VIDAIREPMSSRSFLMFKGAQDLEFRAATKALELEKSGLAYQRVPPDYRFPYGHTHKVQERCTWRSVGAAE
jgi:hypothetical protein